MPVRLNGETYYRSAEACRMVGISKNTFLRWIKDGVFSEVEHRDRRGWRLFTNNDVARLKAKVNHIQKIGQAENKER